MVHRRDVLKGLPLITATLLLGETAQAEGCAGDGTPEQFMPKTAPTPQPLERELEKYPQCPYCGMSRKDNHGNRYVIHYSDNRVDATCSLHCAALSLSLNLDRIPKTIHAADAGGASDPRPLILTENATYLIGSKIPGVMTSRSKVAFAQREAATAAAKHNGGELGTFDDALTATYLDMAKDTMMIRQRREERRKKMAGGHG